MSIENEVAALTTATTALVTEIQISKVSLDTAVSQTTANATAATEQSALATEKAALAAAAATATAGSATAAAASQSSATASAAAALDSTTQAASRAAEALASKNAAEAARSTAVAAAGAIGPVQFYGTKALATGALGSLANGDLVEIAQDESLGGARTRYTKTGGALVFAVNLDQTRVDLSSSDGSGRIGAFGSYASLRLYAGDSSAALLRSGKASGQFVLNPADLSSPDDGCATIIDANGRRWIRDSGQVRLSMLDPALSGLTRLQNAVNAAAKLQVTLQIDEPVSISGTVSCPAGLVVTGAGLITQTAIRAPIFLSSGAGLRQFSGLNMQGKTSDYVNNSSVYAACGFEAVSGASISVDTCRVNGFAGAGVNLKDNTAPSTISNCFITGPGAEYITSTSFNYGTGVNIFGGLSGITVKGCDISLTAQGVVTGDDLFNITISQNYIHDILGQHGAYIASVNGLVFVGNIIKNCGLAGMKVQIGTAGAPDPVDIVISDNVLTHIGAQGVLITNPVGGVPRFRRVNISGNTIKNVGGVGNAGIHVVNTIGCQIYGNLVEGMERGIFVEASEDLKVSHNFIKNVGKEGIYINSVKNSEFLSNTVKSPATLNQGNDAWGMRAQGAATKSLKFINNDISSENDFMRAALYFAEGDQASCEFIGNKFVGGYQYGARMLSAVPVRTWDKNEAAGKLASFLGFPSAHLLRGSAKQVFTCPAMPVSGLYLVGDEIFIPSPAAAASPGWIVTTAGGAMTGAWQAGASYEPGLWYRNASGRVYKLITAGPGPTSVQPTGSAINTEETGLDGYVWLCMSPVSARFCSMPSLSAALALP